MKVTRAMLATLSIAFLWAMGAAAQGPPKVDPLTPDLFIAIRKGDVAAVKALLQQGANWKDATGSA